MVRRSPVIEALVKYPKTISLAAGAFLSIQVCFYILIGFILFEPMGTYGRWLKIRTYFELFPFYRKDMFRRQKSYLKTERTR